jgi:uncharacterized protein (TIGR03905 family)
MKTIEYSPKGVCSQKMIVSAEGNIITEVKIVGGCPGNTLGVSKLCVGKDIDEVIELLQGTPCGMRGTSCPDQLSKALTMLKETK